MSKRKIYRVITFSLLIALLFLIPLLSYIFYNGFDTSKLFLNMRKMGLVGYVRNTDIGLEDVGQIMEFKPDFKDVVVQKKSGKYLISAIATISPSLTIPTKEYDPREPALVEFAMPVEVVTGQKMFVVYNNLYTKTYYEREYLDKNEDLFYGANYYYQHGLDMYYVVDNGYKYLKAGDIVNLIWEADSGPKLINRNGYFEKLLAETPLTNMLIHSR